MSIMPTSNYRGGNFGPSIDKLLGNAYYTVREVQVNLELLTYIVNNMPAMIALAAEYAAIQSLFPSGPTGASNVAVFTALLNSVVGSLPTTEPVGTASLWLNGGVVAFSKQ